MSSRFSSTAPSPEIALTVALGAALAALVCWIVIIEQQQTADHVRAGTTAGQDMAPSGVGLDSPPPR